LRCAILHPKTLSIVSAEALSRNGPAPSIAPGNGKVPRGVAIDPAWQPEGAPGLDTGPMARHELKSGSAEGLHYGPALVLFVIAAIWLLAASRWIVTDTVVPWDAKNQFYAFFPFLGTPI